MAQLRARRRPNASHADNVGQVVEEGEALFKEFVLNEIEKEESVELGQEDFISIGHNYNNPGWAKAGFDLRKMADEFARTKGRKQVQQRAQRVGVSVSRSEFRDLLSELFAQGGVTKERIIVLFYFCSDMAINALRAGRDYFRQFFNWSLSFIAENVCLWVYSHGGWGQVLRSQFNFVSKVWFWVSLGVGAAILFRIHTMGSSPVLWISCTVLRFSFCDLWEETGALMEVAAERQSDKMASDMEAHLKQRCVIEFLHEEQIAPIDIY